MIFPWFLFIVGVALPFSAASFWKRNPQATLLQFTLKAAKRAALLVFLGILIDCSIHKRVHIGMNVLQLIGLAYFAGALLYETPRKVRYAVAAACLVVYWALIRFVPVPGVGVPVFEQDSNIINSINGALRPYHLAGILSVIPTAALVIIGTAFGDMFRNSDLAPAKKLQWLFVAGAALAAAGLLWHLDLEMSKYVWTPSYILFAGGLGAIVLGIFYFVMDMRGWTAWAFPFVVYGMNAITAYFISIMVRIHTVQEWSMTYAGEKVTLWKAWQLFWFDTAGVYYGGWLFTISYVFFWFLVLLWMYRKRIFWRV
jgi:predicted acyltransferase